MPAGGEARNTMIASAHFAAGALSAMCAAHLARHSAARAAVAFGLGMLSHVLLDALPHGDYGELGMSAMIPIVVLELILVSVVVSRVLRNRVMPGWPVTMAAGWVGSVVPDLKFPALLLLPTELADTVAKYGDRFHAPFHAGPAPLVIGVATEVAVTVIMLGLLTTFPKNPR